MHVQKLPLVRTNYSLILADKKDERIKSLLRKTEELEETIIQLKEELGESYAARYTFKLTVQELLFLNKLAAMAPRVASVESLHRHVCPLTETASKIVAVLAHRVRAALPADVIIAIQLNAGYFMSVESAKNLKNYIVAGLLKPVRPR